MNEIKKAAGVNLLIMLIYNIIVHLTYMKDRSEGGLSILLSLVFIVGIHVVTNLILSAIYSGSKYNKLSKAFLISSGVVLLVGFSSCWANASLN